MLAPAEKSLPDLKRLVEETPGAVLALVGDGPCRAELEAHFAGLPVVFMVSDVLLVFVTSTTAISFGARKIVIVSSVTTLVLLFLSVSRASCITNIPLHEHTSWGCNICCNMYAKAL